MENRPEGSVRVDRLANYVSIFLIFMILHNCQKSIDSLKRIGFYIYIYDICKKNKLLFIFQQSHFISVDHGLDSWSTVPFTITIFSIFGRGTWRFGFSTNPHWNFSENDNFSISSLELLCVLISTQVVFFTTHWEKYNTGVMFLSWGYDASQFVSHF